MSSKVAEADRYLKTQRQDNDTGEETHTHITVQYSTIEFSRITEATPTPHIRTLPAGFEGFWWISSWILKAFNFQTNNTTQCKIIGGAQPNISLSLVIIRHLIFCYRIGRTR